MRFVGRRDVAFRASPSCDDGAAPASRDVSDRNAIRASDSRGYRVVAASLRPEDIAAADRIVDALREEGWPHANRSLVVREAIRAMAEALGDGSTEDVFRHFVERRGRRIVAPREPK